MALDPAEQRRLRLAMADLAGAAWYVSRIDDDTARAIVVLLDAALDECKRLLEE